MANETLDTPQSVPSFEKKKYEGYEALSFMREVHQEISTIHQLPTVPKKGSLALVAAEIHRVFDETTPLDLAIHLSFTATQKTDHDTTS